MIHSAHNALSRWTSREAVNVRVAAKKEALEVLAKLQDAERGMQTLLNDVLAVPTDLAQLPDAKVRAWLKAALGRALDVSTAANASVRDLSALV